MDRVRVIVGVPMERTVPGAVFHHFIAIAQQGYAFIRLPYTRCDMARNQFAQHLLENEQFTHLVMLDLDHTHPPDVVERLTRWVVDDPERLVVGGMNFRRGPPYDPCAFILDDEGTPYTLADWEPGLMRVDVLGTGCILIAREVFERIPGPPWFFYDYDQAKEGGWPSDDIPFSRLCREHGIELWMDTTLTSPHLVDGFVGQRTFRSFLEMKEVQNGRDQGAAQVAGR